MATTIQDIPLPAWELLEDSPGSRRERKESLQITVIARLTGAVGILARGRELSRLTDQEPLQAVGVVSTSGR